MAYYLLFAFAWIALGAIQLYRAHTGTRSVGILTFDDKIPLKHQRWAKSLIGIGFIGLGIAYMVLAYLRRPH